MNYKNWNNLLRKYFFDEQSYRRVSLHITLQDLVDYAKKENVEIANGRYASEFDDDFVKRDFASKFWVDRGQKASNIEQLGDKILEIKERCIGENDCQSLLAIVALLIMPLCENDQIPLNGNNYYGHLMPFLAGNGFIDGNNINNNDRGLLAKIRLNDIWEHINTWAETENLPFRANYTGRSIQHSLIRECLLSTSRIQKFRILFERGGLVPKLNIENDRLLSVFSNYYTYIGLSTEKYRQLIQNDNIDYLLNVLREEYDHWDGTTQIREVNRRSGNVRIESGNTYFPLLLYMKYENHTKATSFGFLLYCPQLEEAEDLNFSSESINFQMPSIYIRPDGYASRPFMFEEDVINNIFTSQLIEISEASAQTIKGRFVVTEYFLLKEYKQKFVATNEFIRGEYYYVLIDKNRLPVYEEWLNSNSATFVKGDLFNGRYNMYCIENATTELTDHSNLRFRTQVRCKSVNNIEVISEEETDVIHLSKLFPAHFEITGVDVKNDKIYAVSVNAEKRNSTELTYNHEKGVWILNVFTNIFQLSKEFQLYLNEQPIPYGHTYKFVDFALPQRFKQVALDKWGGVDGNSFTTGLELSEEEMRRNLINWETLHNYMNQVPAIHYNDQYSETDYLLYALTSASYETDRWVITEKWLKNIINRVASELEDDNAPEDLSFSNIIADYFRMGYINYKYSEKGLCITANHPTLILLSPSFQREIMPGGMVSLRCTEHRFKCLLTGGRTISLINDLMRYRATYNYEIEIVNEDNNMLPQSIYIHAEDRNAFRQLAERLNIHYQDNIYANVMLEILPSVDEYEAEIIPYAKERDLFLVKNFRCIDYNRLATLYAERRNNGNPIRNSEINKDSFDSNRDVVTFFPTPYEGGTTVLINGNRMIEIDKYWGHFLGMKISNARIITYDREKSEVCMPLQIRLPLLYARALTLLTGNTPRSTYNSRSFFIGTNPCTFASASNPDAILRKLGQN